MGALTIAFDTIIVGALALFWVLLVIHLFFFEGENRFGDVVDWVHKRQAQAAAGIVLFAITYTLGSAVSRTAQDFFNDDDLYIYVPFLQGTLRNVMTEDRILARVYCDSNENHLLPADASDRILARKFEDFKKQKLECAGAMGLWVADKDSSDDPFVERARDMFGLQENALMDKGGDYTVRLRQLHDQVMVLRGAAFNGVIGFSLCVFAWGLALGGKNPRSWIYWALVPVPLIYFVVGLIAVIHHFAKGFPPDPPYMEFTLFLLTGTGAGLLWRRRSKQVPEKADHKVQPGYAKDTGDEKQTATKYYWQKAHWARLTLLSGVLAFAAFLGWWSTEVLYGDQVIYSYDSLPSDAQATTAVQK